MTLKNKYCLLLSHVEFFSGKSIQMKIFSQIYPCYGDRKKN